MKKVSVVRINTHILSVNEKLRVSKFRYFGNYIIQLDGHISFMFQVNGRLVWRKMPVFASPGTMVQVMHMLFVFFSVLGNLIASFSIDNMSVQALENVTKMVLNVPINYKSEDQSLW